MSAAADSALREIPAGELQALRGWLTACERGSDLVGRVRIGGYTYTVRAECCGPGRWALRLVPETPPGRS